MTGQQGAVRPATDFGVRVGQHKELRRVDGVAKVGEDDFNVAANLGLPRRWDACLQQMQRTIDLSAENEQRQQLSAYTLGGRTKQSAPHWPGRRCH